MNEEIVDQKRKAQSKYATEKKQPLFAPVGGECYSCGRQIYDKIDMETASTTLITGCPFADCKASFCD